MHHKVTVILQYPLPLADTLTFAGAYPLLQMHLLFNLFGNRQYLTRVIPRNNEEDIGNCKRLSDIKGNNILAFHPVCSRSGNTY